MNETMKCMNGKIYHDGIYLTVGDYRIVEDTQEWAIREMNNFIAQNPGKILRAEIIEKKPGENGSTEHTFGWKVTVIKAADANR